MKKNITTKYEVFESTFGRTLAFRSLSGNYKHASELALPRTENSPFKKNKGFKASRKMRIR